MSNYENEECAHSHANKLGCPECGVDFGGDPVSEIGEYTPGPWIIGVDNVVYDGELRQPICDVSFRSESINDRNALLIAAAPDLLEALEELVKINGEHNLAVEAICGRPMGWKDSYLDVARAAIARAKGEQP